MADLLNLMSGFMKGRSNRIKADRELEQLKEQTRAKVSAEKVALEKEKRALLQDQQKQKLMDMLLQNLQSAQGEAETPVQDQTTPMGSSFPKQEGPSLLDELSRGQVEQELPNLPPMNQMVNTPQAPQAGASPIAGMDPMTMALMKEATGVDLIGAGGLAQRRQAEQRLASQGDERIRQGQAGLDIREKTFARGFDEWVPVKVTLPGQGEVTMMMPKYAAGGTPGAVSDGGSIQTKPGINDMPIDEQNLPLWRKKGTLEPAPVGMTPNDAEKQGYVRVTSSQLDAVQGFSQIGNILGQVENLMVKVYPKDEDAVGRITGGSKRLFNSISQNDPNVSTLMGLIGGTLSLTIRSMGEKGALSDGDVKRAIKLYPSITDSGKVAWQKINQLKMLIKQAKESKIGGITEKEKEGLPEKAKAQLKEGIKTKFGNGQIWTLKQGVPERLE